MSHDTDPAVEAWALLWQLMQANKPRFMALAQELGLAPMQLHALRLIEPDVEVPMNSLAGKLFCDASNITGIVDRLEARGLIERRRHPTDRRMWQLYLRDAARPLIAEMREIGDATRSEALAGVSAEDRQRLLEILTTMKGNLTEACISQSIDEKEHEHA